MNKQVKYSNSCWEM